MRNWHKYEIKDSNRVYWTIFFSQGEVRDYPYQHLLGNEHIRSIDWHYNILCGTYPKLENLTDEEISIEVGSNFFTLESEADIDDINRGKIQLYAPSPEEFMMDYHNIITRVLVAAAGGNVIENSLK